MAWRDDGFGRIYQALSQRYGPQGWWPGTSRSAVMVGAVLTQNTNWSNVEKALANLRAAGVWDERPAGAGMADGDEAIGRLRELGPEKVAPLIRPAGYYNLKAARLSNLVAYLWDRCGGEKGGLGRLREVPTATLRGELLAVKGIGPETADAILLYALDRPVFVIDAYARRVFSRHGLAESAAEYHQLQAAVTRAVPAELRVFNEYHALLVEVGKRHCGTTARCEGCPLEKVGESNDEIRMTNDESITQ